jgi:hypothetical protein
MATIEGMMMTEEVEEEIKPFGNLALIHRLATQPFVTKKPLKVISGNGG